MFSLARISMELQPQGHLAIKPGVSASLHDIRRKGVSVKDELLSNACLSARRQCSLRAEYLYVSGILHKKVLLCERREVVLAVTHDENGCF